MQENLNGQWQYGLDRDYRQQVQVPGLVSDPRKPSPGRVWFKRQVQRPVEWQAATLLLKGARFVPSVYIDGQLQSTQEGGMGWTRHCLDLSSTDSSFKLEIALQPLDQIEEHDASRIPPADQWRSNQSSCLWDDVIIRFHGPARIDRLFSYTDDQGVSRVRVYAGGKTENSKLRLTVMDADQHTVIEHSTAYQPHGKYQEIELPGSDQLTLWSPESPSLFCLTAELLDGNQLSDTDSTTLGRRRFEINRKHFELNGHPVTIRAGTVVWHRWLRDPEANELAWDMEWFTANVIMQLKKRGANALRFHLGMPPERILDACDRIGLMVQAEWSFFHGFDASTESAEKQWADWYEMCLRHPSVCILHPWNETNPEVLDKAWAAIAGLDQEFPPVILAHRDVMHVHRYWWSLFENIGLYYDSAEIFDKPIMVDEFGGNYLNREGNIQVGGYPTLIESFTRFLGRNNTVDDRLQLQVDSYGRIAEYWRRIGAAGFSPFCILGAPEDGNHHYLGRLREGRLKPVWDALSAAYAPVSASLNLWDRNFRPGQKLKLEIHLFNDTLKQADTTLRLGLAGQAPVETRKISLSPASHQIISCFLSLPPECGEWTIEVILDHPDRGTAAPSRSSWRVWTILPTISESNPTACSNDSEYQAFISQHQLDHDPGTVYIGGNESYKRLVEDKEFGRQMERRLQAGKHILLLNAGPQFHGKNHQGQPSTEQDNSTPDAAEEIHFLPFSAKVLFRPVPEPESVIHPADRMEDLWAGLEKENTAIWAGLKAGIIVPAMDLQLQGFSAAATLEFWTTRGADPEAMKRGPYFAYEKAGCFHFSTTCSQAEEEKLNRHLKFLVADAPALANSISLRTPVVIHDLHQQLEQASGNIHQVKPLIVCGKLLARNVTCQIEFENVPGKLILSQLLTDNRLVNSFAKSDGRHPDTGAQQLVLNLIQYLASLKQ